MEGFVKERSILLNAVRTYFSGAGFIEVQTPELIPYMNPDTNVDNVKVRFRDFSGRQFNWFLHTSPEFFMKRLIWSGVERCFQVCKVFRDGEITPLHSIEFTMVEWYRTGGNYFDGIEEAEDILRVSLEALSKKFLLFEGKRIYLSELEVFTVNEAFNKFASVLDVLDKEEVCSLAEEEDYETAFHKLLVEKVEPALSLIDVPVVLKDYPPEFSAMAKINKKWAERFELYIAGVEVANGYSELTDFDSYAKKFAKKSKEAVDCGFLELLKEKPLPECEGVALGFDRLLMLAVGASSVHDVIPFSTRYLVKEVNLSSQRKG